VEEAKAFRSQIGKAMLAVLCAAATKYQASGDPDSDLRDAPEYVLTVELANGLTKAFSTLRYRLEHHASAYAVKAIAEVDISEATGKEGARFDIVLLNRADNVPRYIVEVKRGTKIMSDAKRIIQIAALQHGRRRWQHGFLVTLLRRPEREVASIVDQLRMAIENFGRELFSAAGNRQTIAVKAVHECVGDSREAGKQLYGVVFQISVLRSDHRNFDDKAEQELAI
jgi:hypothetical protein